MTETQLAFDQCVRHNWKHRTDELAMDFVHLRDLYVMTAGLAGETGEVIEHLKKYVRDGVLDRNALALELGDVLHYLTRIAQEFELTLDEIRVRNMHKLRARNASASAPAASIPTRDQQGEATVVW